ncbi:MAG TPA: hypothetical protein DCF45_11660 [Gammaproteobacteria bacterium]|nr:hypothetical protein [Gammaproteobacteria bacterium]
MAVIKNEAIIEQQLNRLDHLIEEMRSAVVVTDCERVVTASTELQVLVDQLERRYDGCDNPSELISESLAERLGSVRKKLAGTGTLIQLSRAKAADLLELMLGTAPNASSTYSESGRFQTDPRKTRSLTA